jgi:hypothetical protein
MIRRIAISLFALGLVTGPVAADGLDIGGEARMGLFGTTTVEDGHRVRLLHELDLTLRLSRTTDSGLTIGLQLDLDDLLEDGPRHGRLPEAPPGR